MKQNETIKLFNNRFGAMIAIEESVDFICGDWSPYEGFGSSDRVAVYHSALRNIIPDFKAWEKGEVEIDVLDMMEFRSICDDKISEALKANEIY